MINANIEPSQNTPKPPNMALPVTAPSGAHSLVKAARTSSLVYVSLPPLAVFEKLDFDEHELIIVGVDDVVFDTARAIVGPAGDEFSVAFTVGLE